MQTYARIHEYLVVEKFTTGRDITSLFHPALIWVNISSIDPQPEVGWSFKDGIFRLPPEPDDVGTDEYQ